MRVVPLAQALLDVNPELEITLVTARAYLYAHPRITLVSIDDRAAVRATLRQRFEVVAEFFEPNVLTCNHDFTLRPMVAAHLREQEPFLEIGASKGYNHFVYSRLNVESSSYLDGLALNRQRVPSVYETTFRLISSLGLPLRLGEERAVSDPVIAGIRSQEAEAAWRDLTRGNVNALPVALMNPFGGGEPLKGYVEYNLDELLDRIRETISEGFFVVLLPNGTPWGTRDLALKAVEMVPLDERRMVRVGPDPATQPGPTTYRCPYPITMPGPSHAMHLVTYFIRFADRVVAVEGWAIHAAYVLGKPFRILLQPYSYLTGWHPYGRTGNQTLVRPVAVMDSSGSLQAHPPLPSQPRKLVLLASLRVLETVAHPRIAAILRWAACSEDRDLRRMATSGLRRQSDPTVSDDLPRLLEDSSSAVRAEAAAGLLARIGDELPSVHFSREQLLAYRWIGEKPRRWRNVIDLGDAARPALLRALHDDDEVVRREAGHVLARLAQPKHLPLQPRKPPPLETLGASLPSWTAMKARLPFGRRQVDAQDGPKVLILTPVKDAADCLESYCARLSRLTFPHSSISLGFLESDSMDGTYEALRSRVSALKRQFRRVGLWKRDFGYRIPPGVHRGAEPVQFERRTVLAKSRNHLLLHALDDEEWVLWLDIDVIAYASDLIERLLATGKDIVQPHCVLRSGGPTFDRNGWRDQSRYHLDDLRSEGELVRLDAVGGTVLLVRADLHRDGLIFPSFPYGRPNPRIRGDRAELETEGLGIMAHDMGYECWGMPHFEVIHRPY